MVVPSVDLSWWELTGLLGACLYAIGYLFAAFDRLPSQSIQYYLVKMVAATLVLVSLTQSFNLASVVIQVFFIAVSLIGIVRHVGQGRPSGPSRPIFVDSASVVLKLSQSDTAERNWRRRSDLG